MHIVRVTGNVTVPAVPANENIFGTGTGITVTLEGGSFTLSGTGSMLRIGSDQTVIARNIALRGHANNNSPVVNVGKRGTFRMEGSASISDNHGGAVNPHHQDYMSASGVLVYGGNLIMQDSATVSGNIGRSISLTNVHYTVRVGLSGRSQIAVATFVMQDNSSLGRNGVGASIFGGTFTMQDNASVQGNTNAGVQVMPPRGIGGSGGTFTMQDNPSVSGNSNGGVIVSAGTFTMRDNSSVSGNTGGSWNGGGVTVGAGGLVASTFTMHDNATVSRNTNRYDGGGVIIVHGTFTMRDNSSVSGNTASRRGGGVFFWHSNDSFFVMYGGTISDNTSNIGGGVYVNNFGTFTMNNGTISRNVAAQNGGGVVLRGQAFTMNNGNISGNRATQNGGGVHIVVGDGWQPATFTKSGGTIYGGNAEGNLRNTAARGAAIFHANGNWRNTTAGPTMNTGAFGFWLNEPN